jgi:hypothetical protein
MDWRRAARATDDLGRGHRDDKRAVRLKILA